MNKKNQIAIPGALTLEEKKELFEKRQLKIEFKNESD